MSYNIYHSFPVIFIMVYIQRESDFNLNYITIENIDPRITPWMNTRVSLDFFFHHAGNKIVAITVEWQPLIATRITSIYLNGKNASFHAYITG